MLSGCFTVSGNEHSYNSFRRRVIDGQAELLGGTGASSSANDSRPWAIAY